MGSFLRRWIITFIAVLIVALALPSLVSYRSLLGVAIFAAVLALLNSFIRPILMILALPINIITLGLFVLVVNGFVFWLAGVIYPGVIVPGFWGAVLAALLVSIISYVANRLVR